MKELRVVIIKIEPKEQTRMKKMQSIVRRHGGWQRNIGSLPSLTSMSMWCAELDDLSLLEGRELVACSCILARSPPPASD
jgi:hypothetical protein